MFPEVDIDEFLTPWEAGAAVESAVEQLSGTLGLLSSQTSRSRPPLGDTSYNVKGSKSRDFRRFVAEL